MRSASLTDDSLEVDVGSEICRQPGIESGGGLSAGLPYLIGFQRSFDDVGDRTPLPPCQAVSKITGFGATDGKLRLSHFGHLQLAI
jgi:hypothetical protein